MTQAKNLLCLTSLFLALVLITDSCEKGLPGSRDVPFRLERRELNFSALQAPGPSETRTGLAEGTLVYWSPSDEVALLSSAGKDRFVSQNAEMSATAVFRGKLSLTGETSKQYVYALYPYDAEASLSSDVVTTSLPSTQTAAAGSFSNRLLITSTRVPASSLLGGDAALSFRNVCSGIRFTLDRSDIRSVTVTARGGEALAGTFSFSFGESGIPSVKAVSSPSSSITLTAPDGGTFEAGVSYYFVTLPASLSQGVDFSFVTADARGERSIATPFDLERGTFPWKEHLDSGVDFSGTASGTGDFDPESHSIVVDEDFRAVWVATVKNLDFPRSNGTAAQKQELVSLFKSMKQLGFNAIVFQVNPMADAFWDSELLPWSTYLTGTEGEDPGYDPLQLAVETAHAEGMELHAWLNPYRIGPKDLVRAASHPMNSHSDWYQEYDGSYYWDPGNPDTRSFIASLVTELVGKYDVDGIHIDDYFYPNKLYSEPGTTWDDSSLYETYKGGKTLEEWRIDNVDQTVRAMARNTHAAAAHVVFGASPASSLSYTHRLYAYPEHWLEQDLLDYLCPQIYNGGGTFDSLFKTFNDMPRQEHCFMFPGLAPYKVVYKEEGEDKALYGHPEELLRQVTKTEDAGHQGTIWFRAAFCMEDPLLDYIPGSIYKSEALTPLVSQSPKVLASPVVTVNGLELNWGEVQGAADYVVMEIVRKSPTSDKWDAQIVQSGSARSYTGLSGHYYVVLSRSGASRSPVGNVVYLR